ncbi:vascular endothelial growth factor C-like [Anguilla rostrata]|uniref:vascular endothelial growth factor C-like n=1 Tax=Anguilla rostrata TaxID=7938 RepID=UPI0030D1ECAF
MWMFFTAAVWIAGALALARGYGFGQDYYEAAGDAEDTELGSVGESRLDGVTSVDELLEMLYPEYSLVQHCLRKRAPTTPYPPGPKEGLWGSPLQAAHYKVDGTLEAIMEEMQRVACRPREVCLEVSKEYLRFCTNTSQSLVNKTLVQLSPPQSERTVIMATFVNHTACECQPKRPLRPIIRRAAAFHHSLCSPPDTPCDVGLVWDPTGCQCVSEDESALSAAELDPLDAALLALCGPSKVLDEERCECVCQNGLTEASCGPGWRLDEAACECVCEGQPAPGACPPNQRWDPELCGCVCSASCPRSQPLNPETCLCQCRESSQTCLLQGKKFNPQTCSCYRLPCRNPHRKCPTGFYYSHYVCHCVPNYMRSGEWN